MKLTVNAKNYQYDNDIQVLNDMSAKINQEIEDSGLFFSHFLIDGELVYEGYEDYFIQHIQTIHSVEVILLSTKEMLNGLLLSFEQYLANASPEVNQLVQDFYQNPTAESWLQFERLLEGIQWIAEVVTTIDKHENDIKSWDEYLKGIAQLQVELQQLMEALENKDSVLLADILQYEIIPIFDLLKKLTTETIDEQFERKGIS
ncbi:hypothetical protein [Alkalihalobacillus trypoxylicola]|uniref:DUF8042 domain-containing protein n=1 Tax=Alkalihalobacillus trypoxylicola TaxID=519424 RepID=A0A162ETQ4_9BACI|nr:hypothetical protein [Alkalihalobacillus trypoxylicola]KYG33702.1 hypothetical protein AZF04_15875 [Alkalihalobacillus trypoxylicola]